MKYNFTNEEILTIVDDYSQKMIPIYKIAKEYNVDATVINRILIENNVDIINGSAFSKKYWIKRGLSDLDAEKKNKRNEAISGRVLD